MHFFWEKKREPEPLKGLAAGLLGGLAGSLAMHLFQYAVRQLSQEREEPQRDPRDRPIQNWSHYGAEPYQREVNEQLASPEEPPQEPARVQAAEFISENVLRRRLPEHLKGPAGEVLHIGFGTTVGAGYGLLAEYYPEATWGQGSVFGTGLMIASDEIAVPALGLSDPPHKHPATTHLYALGSHLVYGVTCELVRQGIRRLL